MEVLQGPKTGLQAVVNWPSCQRFTLELPPDYNKSCGNGTVRTSPPSFIPAVFLIILLLCVMMWMRSLATQNKVYRKWMTNPLIAIKNTKSKEKSLILHG